MESVMNDESKTPMFDVLSAVAIAEMEQHIRDRMCGQLHGFRLLSGKLGLVLLGRTRTYHAKQLAQHALMEITDLPIQANEIEVC
jgi:hypothetical protein